MIEIKAVNKQLEFIPVVSEVNSEISAFGEAFGASDLLPQAQSCITMHAISKNATVFFMSSISFPHYFPIAPSQYSQRPLAVGIVWAPQKGQVTATLGASAAAFSSLAC